MTAAIQALVIGNGSYPGKLCLTSPKADAEQVARTLKELKIDVVSVIDEPYSSALSHIDAFIEKVNLPKTAASVLYYSGHGVQINDTNYIVPIDFRDVKSDEKIRLISVQSIVDKMTSATATRIVLLDACRTGKDASASLIAGTKRIEVDKSFFLNGEEVPTAGLAEMKAVGNTFIAFAAGPGEVAREGSDGNSLSPFTNSLVRHLTSVDLPLSNLTGRIRQEVLAETEGRQRTWDQSSLVAPFYFNPGSLLLFTSNVMAVIGLAISTIIYSLVLLSPYVTMEWIAAALILPAASFTMLMAGAQNAYARLRGAFAYDDGNSRLRLLADLRNGAAGGFLGALIGGLFVSAPYFLEWRHPSETFGQLWLEVTCATAFAACIVGPFALSGAHLWLAPKDGSILNQAARLVFGSAAGGMLAGLIAAPVITWYFGRITGRPEMGPLLLLPGSVICASAVIFSVINFDLERLSGRRLLINAASSFLAVLLGGPFAVLVFAPLYLLGAVSAVTVYLEHHYASPAGLLAGGALYGAPVGLVLGFVVGAAISISGAASNRSRFA
jgi:Caspase domain